MRRSPRSKGRQLLSVEIRTNFRLPVDGFLADSDLLEDKPGVVKVPFAGGVAVLELPEPGALIVVKTILPPQGTA